MKNKINKLICELKQLRDESLLDYTPQELELISEKYTNNVMDIVESCYIDSFEWDDSKSIKINISHFINIVIMLIEELNNIKV